MEKLLFIVFMLIFKFRVIWFFKEYLKYIFYEVYDLKDFEKENNKRRCDKDI